MMFRAKKYTTGRKYKYFTEISSLQSVNYIYSSTASAHIHFQHKTCFMSDPARNKTTFKHLKNSLPAHVTL